MRNTPRSDKIEMMTPHNALGIVALDLARNLEIENSVLRLFIERWRYESNLQTFGNRSLFRKEAEELLNAELTED